MTAKTRTKTPAPVFSGAQSDDPWSTALQTTETRLPRIQALGKLIEGHIAFMCSDDRQSGSSGESRENAVATFHECLARTERELARIRESFQLA